MTVVLLLDPKGCDVAAFSGSINYNQDVLDYAGVVNGPEIRADESEALNTNDRDAGMVGVGLLIDGVSKLIKSGSQGVVAKFKFKVRPGAEPGSYPVFFDDTPTSCNVATSQGHLLDADWVPGTTTITK